MGQINIQAPVNPGVVFTQPNPRLTDPIFFPEVSRGHWHNRGKTTMVGLLE